MTGYINHRSALVKQLIASGFIPETATRVQITFDVHDAVRMTIECLVSEKEFQVFCDAIRDYPEDARRIARTIVLRSEDRENDVTDSSASIEI